MTPLDYRRQLVLIENSKGSIKLRDISKLFNQNEYDSRTVLNTLWRIGAIYRKGKNMPSEYGVSDWFNNSIHGGLEKWT